MEIQVDNAPNLQEVKIVTNGRINDDRGFFQEIYRYDKFMEKGLPTQFVQDNHSKSTKGVIRGLHFQWEPPMSKIMRVMKGTAYLVAVDIRKGSPTLGEWFGIEVADDSQKQLWAPAGFARGFCVLSETAEIEYKCTAVYNNKGESGILWNDPEIGIEWPVKDPILSDKDANAQTLSDWVARPESENFRY